MGWDSYLPLKKSVQSVIDQNLPYQFLRGQPLKFIYLRARGRLHTNLISASLLGRFYCKILVLVRARKRECMVYEST